MCEYKLGLVSVSFRNLSAKEIVECASAAGLSCIEWGSDVHAPFNDYEKINEIVRLQKEYGMNCSSYGTYFRIGQTPLEQLEKYIEAAKMLGTRILRLWCGTKSGAEYSETERESLLSGCRRAANIAESLGVILCMECHKKTFTERLEDSLMLMSEVDSPSFRMYWQPFQWLESEENLKIAHALTPYAEHVHVFNWKGEEKLPLSEAENEWRAYLGALLPPRTLLLEFMPDGKSESLSREADALRKIIGDKK